MEEQNARQTTVVGELNDVDSGDQGVAVDVVGDLPGVASDLMVMVDPAGQNNPGLRHASLIDGDMAGERINPTGASEGGMDQLHIGGYRTSQKVSLSLYIPLIPGLDVDRDLVHGRDDICDSGTSSIADSHFVPPQRGTLSRATRLFECDDHRIRSG